MKTYINITDIQNVFDKLKLSHEFLLWLRTNVRFVNICRWGRFRSLTAVPKFYSSRGRTVD